MPYFLGTDEAGYGPNLGPLVITTTAWRVPDGVTPDELYGRLVEVVTAEIQLGDGDSRLQIADSKLLYQPRGTLARLERTVLAACGLLGRPIAAWRDAWHALAADCDEQLAGEPSCCDYFEPLPVDCPLDELRLAVAAFRAGLQACEIELVDVRCRVLFPNHFNGMLDQQGNKGNVLSYATLELARDVMRSLANEPLLLVCDKHGGRNKYAALLQTLFPDHWIEVRQEGRAASVYRWGPADCQNEARFVAKGEGYLPAALASMVSKYMRELAMRAFNHYWRLHVPGVRPTAGYPGDARRFKQEIAAAQIKLGIDDRMLWRQR